jgi:protein-tyrosine kinase
MSKIVDALRKIQDDKSESERRHRKIGRIETSSANGKDSLEDTANYRVAEFQPTKIVQIDRDAMQAAGILPPEAEAKLFEDEYRVIKRPILGNAFGRNAASVENGFVVLVTSALAGDGKTFTCVNLALSLARELESNVLLVDADVRKPHISTLFDAQDEDGLLDFLDGSKSDPIEVELPTSVKDLAIVPTGKSRANATELLSGKRMSEFIERVHRRDPHRIILIDSSPILLTTESRALAAIAGQIVLVVRAGATPKAAVLDAADVIDAGKPVNVVLNEVRHSGKSGYYGGYYGGGYGTPYGDTDDLKTAKT